MHSEHTNNPVRKGQLGHLMKVFMFIVALCFWVSPAMAQDEMTMLSDPAFTTRQRPAVMFVHDLHNEKAEIEDCSVCHHVYEDGKLVEGESSEDESCSSCHPAKPQGKELGLMRAYHTRCITCHSETKKGPLSCGQCHVNK